MTEHNLNRAQTEVSQNRPLPSSVLHNGDQMRAAYTRLAARRAAQSAGRLMRVALRGKQGLANTAMPEA